jgi:putative YhbY family RNA-binding protein
VWSKETLPNSEGTNIQKKQLRRLQTRSRDSEATIWIGKQGLTDHLLKQVASQLKTRELVKMKVQKSALKETETTELAQKVAASTDSTLVDVLGHTFTVYKRKERPQREETRTKPRFPPN